MCEISCQVILWMPHIYYASFVHCMEDAHGFLFDFSGSCDQSRCLFGCLFKQFLGCIRCMRGWLFLLMFAMSIRPSVCQVAEIGSGTCSVCRVCGVSFGAAFAKYPWSLVPLILAHWQVILCYRYRVGSCQIPMIFLWPAHVCTLSVSCVEQIIIIIK